MKEQTKEMTPMMKLIDEYEKNKILDPYVLCLHIRDKIEELLPEERKMVEDAYEGGYAKGYNDATKEAIREIHENYIPNK